MHAKTSQSTISVAHKATLQGRPRLFRQFLRGVLGNSAYTQGFCWSGARLLVNSAYPTAPHTIPNTNASLPSATMAFPHSGQTRGLPGRSRLQFGQSRAIG